MDGLFSREQFTGFGCCGLDPEGHCRLTVIIQGQRPRTLRGGVRRDCPRLPGVYGMVDAAGELIYVGKAKSLRTRLLGYFRGKSRNDKAGKIIRETRRLLWEVAPSEFSALLRELELIRRFRPRWNVHGQPRRHRRTYLCVGRRPAPQAYVTSRPPATALACFGPFLGYTRTSRAVRHLNDWYRLRDCPQKQEMLFADQTELFPLVRTAACVRHEIGQCLAPCAGACSRKEYTFHVEAMLEFLRGIDTTPLEQLDRSRADAAAALEFERAAILRDRLESLQWMHAHLERIRQAQQHSFLYPVENHDRTITWFVIRRGLVHQVCATQEEAERMLDTLSATPEGPPGLEEIDNVLLVASWFRRHRHERRKVVPAESASRAALPR
ncbi:MAG: GIY-YIG nuclease family protein [Gemmataceae bacterium]